MKLLLIKFDIILLFRSSYIYIRINIIIIKYFMSNFCIMEILEIYNKNSKYCMLMYYRINDIYKYYNVLLCKKHQAKFSK